MQISKIFYDLYSETIRNTFVKTASRVRPGRAKSFDLQEIVEEDGK